MYVVRGNQDQNEGRGPEVDREHWMLLEDAHKSVMTGRWGVQGLPIHTKIYERVIQINLETLQWDITDNLMWGHHQSADGKWRYEWVDDRDVSEFLDPEFKEYFRLKNKFNGI